MSLQPSYKQFNKHVQTCCASGRSCPPNYTVRNVWRAPSWDAFSPFDLMFKIYCDSYHFGHTCPPNHTVRNVSRASPFGSVRPLGTPPWPLGPFGLPTSPEDAFRTLLRHARHYFQTSRRVSSVGGSAMHMKRPDGIGREAGSGRTRNRKELNVFRACP